MSSSRIHILTHILLQYTIWTLMVPIARPISLPVRPPYSQLPTHSCSFVCPCNTRTGLVVDCTLQVERHHHHWLVVWYQRHHCHHSCTSSLLVTSLDPLNSNQCLHHYPVSTPGISNLTCLSRAFSIIGTPGHL